MKNSRLFTIPSHRAFAPTLAEWVLQNYGKKPEALSRVLILLPSRRAIRALREAFLRVSGGEALLLPQMEGMGDVDEKWLLRHARLSAEQLNQLQALPDAIAPLDRIWQLSDLVWRYRFAEEAKLTRQSQAIEMAQLLAEFLDELQREQCPWERFDALVPEDYAAHWQHTVRFLRIIREEWPQMLAENNRMDPWPRRNSLLELLAGCWRENPPDFPVIAAGSTGSIPAVSQLLQVIAGLPQGSVFLPGLDTQQDDESDAVLEESHPQYGLKQLLQKLETERRQVGLMPPDSAMTEREKWLSVALQPARTTAEWRSATLDVEAARAKTHMLECETIQQEALTVALLLRETLEYPAKTAALVTPNRELARRVQGQLRRWGVRIDDSAGKPLYKTVAATFLMLLWQAVEREMAPVALLALLKHPLLRLGRPAAEIRSLARRLEMTALRGLAPQSGVDITQKLAKDPELQRFVRQLEAALQPLIQMLRRDKLPLHSLIEAHIQVAESLSRDENNQELLWQGEAAEQLADFLRELQRIRQDGMPIPARDYGNTLHALLQTQTFRSAWGSHPRLHILSPMEARMQHYDRVILSDLNEGGWPSADTADPWLNRPMRQILGLPAPERRIGLLAHDFVQLACAAEVFFTRSTKVGGAVTLPSRFLERMQAVLEIRGGAGAVRQWKDHPVRQWAARMDQPEAAVRLARPVPNPPVAVRPRRLSVTRIEKLLRDPYSVYAQKILRLEPLEPLEKTPQAAEFGNAVHAALEQFLQGGDRSEAALLACGRQAFTPYAQAFVVEALWWPRFTRIAQWFLQQEWPDSCRVEIKGEWQFAAPAGPFTVEARVDRIDITEDGIALIDYKTGTPPSQKEIRLGLANQLLLAAVMAEQGAFGEELRHKPVLQLAYWQLSGGKNGGTVVAVKPEKDRDLEEYIREAAEKLPKLIARFDRPEVGYPAMPDGRHLLRYNDYEHLARSAEWSTTN